MTGAKNEKTLFIDQRLHVTMYAVNNGVKSILKVYLSKSIVTDKINYLK